MKKLIITILVFSSYLFINLNNAYSATINTLPSANNVQIGNTSGGNGITNSYLDKLGGNGDIKAGSEGEKSVYYLVYSIAKDLKTIFYILSGLYFLILVIKLIFSENTDEEISNFKKGLIWITIGIMVMQISFYAINTLYARDVGGTLANNLTKNLISPIIKILETAASFFFVLIAIFAFYSIITANGDEEKVKTGKMSIFYGLIGFIVVKIAKEIVNASYGKVDCNETTILGIFTINGNNCNASSQIVGISDIIIKIINWMNGFVGIIVIIMIIYAGVQVLFSVGDEDKLGKAKSSIVYIVIGIAILILNYFILSFLIKPETII
ncbi:MAG: hypothetical protein PHV23_03715 [Candidatus Gracilibacteria bacterium]|nr:hypothetical protein [Candidatus Gracilibacteria bacterium]